MLQSPIQSKKQDNRECSGVCSWQREMEGGWTKFKKVGGGGGDRYVIQGCQQNLNLKIKVIQGFSRLHFTNFQGQS